MTAALDTEDRVLTTSFGVEYRKSEIVGFEARNVSYCPGDDGKNDLHVVKEYVHLKDGRKIPNMRHLFNYKRSFWITKKGFQNHQDKKEYEELDRLQEFKTTQIGMRDAVSRALTNRPAGRYTMRDLAKTPYLYGSDIETSALIKKAYRDKYPDCISPQAEVAVFDIETDVARGTGDIIVATLAFKNKMITAVSEDFVKGDNNVEYKVRKVMEKKYNEIIEAKEAELTKKFTGKGFSGNELISRVTKGVEPVRRGLMKKEVEIVVCANGAACLKAIFKRAHEWAPDFICVWNLNYDIPYAIKILEEAGEDLADIFSDPTIPKEFRYFKYIEGKKQKVTQDGKITPLHPAEQWHIVECPASFYFIDSMCMYLRLRIAKGKEQSYGLDAILTKHGQMGKLSLPEYDKFEGLRWHQEMQRKEPYFYIVYNQYDCIGVELFDEEKGDVSRQFPILCGLSDYRNFTKNPRRIVDDLHFFYMERGKVIGTTGAEVGDENDEFVTGLRGWIK